MILDDKQGFSARLWALYEKTGVETIKYAIEAYAPHSLKALRETRALLKEARAELNDPAALAELDDLLWLRVG